MGDTRTAAVLSVETVSRCRGCDGVVACSVGGTMDAKERSLFGSRKRRGGGAAAIALAYDNNSGRFAVQYLYGLCGVMIVSALYLFLMYWRTMKSVLYANDAAVVRGETALAASE